MMNMDKPKHKPSWEVVRTVLDDEDILFVRVLKDMASNRPTFKMESGSRVKFPDGKHVDFSGVRVFYETPGFDRIELRRRIGQTMMHLYTSAEEWILEQLKESRTEIMERRRLADEAQVNFGKPQTRRTGPFVVIGFAGCIQENLALFAGIAQW